MQTSEQHLSKVISFLRFPLCVAVVYIHSRPLDYMNGIYPLTERIYQIISVNIAGIAVPMFFFVSGFLFFYKVEQFNIDVYKYKMKKRFYSLIIPYLFWNLFIICMLFLMEFFFPELMSGKHKLISDYKIEDFFYAFWNTNLINSEVNPMPSPICGQFWFLRDLIVMCICSPIFYFVINCFKKVPVLFLGLLSILWLSGLWFPIHIGLGLTGCIFFSMGAYFSITKRNFLDEMTPYLKWALLLYILLVIVQNIFIDKEQYNLCLHRLDILCGIVVVFGLLSSAIKKNKVHENKLLTDSNFFIYAFHGAALSLITKLLLKFLPIDTDVEILCLYILAPIIVILLSIFIYSILKKYFPLFVRYTCKS